MDCILRLIEPFEVDVHFDLRSRKVSPNSHAHFGCIALQLGVTENAMNSPLDPQIPN
jgi:hypothetical protein